MASEAKKEAKWYVAHTYSGYENKIKSSLEQTIQNRNLQNRILEVLVPMEDVVEEKKGEQVTVSRKKFPGYIFIKMILDNELWYIIRNTNGVTGFVGADSKDPDPLTPDEIKNLELSPTKYMITVNVGDAAQIIGGPYEGAVGKVSEINNQTGEVTVVMSVFGSDVPVTLSFEQIKKV